GSCSQGEIRLWDNTSHRPIRTPIVIPPDSVIKLAFNPSGAILASSSCGRRDDTGQCAQGEIRLLNAASGEQIGAPLAGHPGGINSLAYNRDGTILASGGRNGTIILWDVATGRPRGTPLADHTDMVSSIAFSPDGKTLASASWDHTIILWDVATGRP